MACSRVADCGLGVQRRGDQELTGGPAYFCVVSSVERFSRGESWPKQSGRCGAREDFETRQGKRQARSQEDGKGDNAKKSEVQNPARGRDREENPPKAGRRRQEFYARAYSNGLNSLIRKGAWPRNDFRLSVPGYIAVARKRRSWPRFWDRASYSSADLQIWPREAPRFSGAVWFEVGQAGSRLGVLENRPDWPGATPVLAVNSRCLERAGIADRRGRRASPAAGN